uniref:S9 family peptidase n=1 Tax=Paractinoplanes polyasparticus TaxID=2856853 RepID=UPI001C853CB2|nr:prolyl oligopeptidase family serine peptidase [Actinoplanes polyasparticus]
MTDQRSPSRPTEQVARPEPLTVDELFEPPARTAAAISADGALVGYLAPWRDRVNVWVQSTAQGIARRVTAEDHSDVQSFHWTDDPRWLLYLSTGEDGENCRLYRADLDVSAGPALDLTPSGSGVVALDLPVGRPGTALVRTTGPGRQSSHLYEVDIATGGLTLLGSSPEASDVWFRGAGGVLYVARPTGDGGTAMLRWDGASGTFHSAAPTIDAVDWLVGLPIRTTPDGAGVWVGSSSESGVTVLQRLDLTTGERTEIDRHPWYDLDTRAAVLPVPSPLVVDRRTGELIGVRYLRERQVIRPLNAHFRAVLGRLESLSGGDIADLSSDQEGRRWVVSFNDDRDPGTTYFYDHATGESRLLFRPHPHLGPHNLAPLVPVSIPARDGTESLCHLTLPVGVSPRGLATVLIVGGGPGVRNYWGYDAAAQLFANRGFAVLRMTSPGSPGFPRTYLDTATGEPRDAMLEDMLGVVEWAVEQGYSDWDRVAIFGEPEGEQAALAGAFYSPEVFAAAVEFSGVVADVASRLPRLPARSPGRMPDRTRTPLLMLRAAGDRPGTAAGADEVAGAAAARGVAVEHVDLDDGGRRGEKRDQVVAMFHAADLFLQRHLGSAR